MNLSERQLLIAMFFSFSLGPCMLVFAFARAGVCDAVPLSQRGVLCNKAFLLTIAILGLLVSGACFGLWDDRWPGSYARSFLQSAKSAESERLFVQPEYTLDVESNADPRDGL